MECKQLPIMSIVLSSQESSEREMLGLAKIYSDYPTEIHDKVRNHAFKYLMGMISKFICSSSRD